MKRKVVKHGPSTFVVSLPSDWVKRYGVQKGGDLEVTEEGNSLHIKIDDDSKSTEVEIDISGLDRTTIMYIIRSLYRLGYDVIIVKFDNSKTEYQRKNKEINVLSVIHTEVNRLIGYEIINEKEKSCHIKDLQIISRKDFDQVLRRIFLLLISASEEFLQGVKTQNLSLLETIDDKHDTITKFVSYCLRILSKKGHIDSKKTNNYYHILALLDRVTDLIKYSARDTISYNQKFDSKSIEILEIINKSLRDYYELFYNYNNKHIHKINDNRYIAETAIKNLPDSVKTLEVIVITNMVQISEILLDLIESRTALEY